MVLSAAMLSGFFFRVCLFPIVFDIQKLVNLVVQFVIFYMCTCVCVSLCVCVCVCA